MSGVIDHGNLGAFCRRFEISDSLVRLVLAPLWPVLALVCAGLVALIVGFATVPLVTSPASIAIPISLIVAGCGPIVIGLMALAQRQGPRVLDCTPHALVVDEAAYSRQQITGLGLTAIEVRGAKNAIHREWHLQIMLADGRLEYARIMRDGAFGKRERLEHVVAAMRRLLAC